jgi:class 3 adenylate cyclase
MAKGDLRRPGRGLRHTGGVEVRDDDIAGLAVTIAKRVHDLAEAEGVLVSETVGGFSGPGS